MSGDPIAPPRPTEIDEPSSMEFRHLSATHRDPAGSGAYIPVRVPNEPRPDGSILVYLPNGTALVVNGNQLLHTQRSRTDDY